MRRWLVVGWIVFIVVLGGWFFGIVAGLVFFGLVLVVWREHALHSGIKRHFPLLLNLKESQLFVCRLVELITPLVIGVFAHVGE